MASVTINSLNVFLIASEKLSFTDTAKFLNISQPAVSRVIKHLESQYNCRLFTRGEKGLDLTPEGKLLRQKASNALAELEAAQTAIDSRQRLVSGTLSVGSSHMLTHYYLLDVLETFHKENPNISIHMENSGILETVRCLLDERIEIGIVTTPFGFGSGIEFIPFANMQDCFLAGEEFLHLKKKTLSLKTLSNYPLIVMKEGRITRPYQEKCFLSRGAVLKPEMECDMMSLIADFASSGLGIGWVDKKVAEEAIRLHPTMFIIKLDKDLPPRKIGVIKRSGTALSPSAQAFMDILKNRREASDFSV